MRKLQVVYVEYHNNKTMVFFFFLNHNAGNTKVFFLFLCHNVRNAHNYKVHQTGA